MIQSLNIACCAVALTLCARDATHLLQLESYQQAGYFRALRRNGRLWFLPGVLMTGIWLVCAVIAFFLPMFGILPPVAALVAGVAYAIIASKKAQKKPLKYTARVKRLVCATLLWSAAWSALAWFLMGRAMGLLFLFLPLLVSLAALTAQPVEKAINRGYFKDAQARLDARPDLVKIGITGSYGKTSTKFILAAILSEKYRVLATPSSFNTPMGLTRVIREQLAPDHQVFIAEMGARHVGDIRELCQLVRPTVGAITSIGPQHLETMGTVENVKKTKYELIDALPKDGAAFFAADVARRWGGQGTTAGLSQDADVYARDIEVGAEGSSFTLCLPGGVTQRMTTRLLGEHNIANIALCCAVAHHMGLAPEEIAAGVAKAEPVEHRLQLIRGAGGNIVIDDAFNSNPVGAKAALDVLAAFTGRKIIVTPGMVELGEREEELNQEFGRQIAEAADIAILVGKSRARPMHKGLAEKGFPQENTHIVDSLDEAAKLLGTLARTGDVTLFENDLPDNY